MPRITTKTIFETKPAVLSAYEGKLGEIEAHLEELSTALDKHAQNKLTYAHVGDLGMIAARLNELLACFRPQPEETV